MRASAQLGAFYPACPQAPGTGPGVRPGGGASGPWSEPARPGGLPGARLRQIDTVECEE
jgi:hypothetical protein